ncbi:MAG TPA: hypothetical protein VKT77_11350, partial [Chthonomonadaceae bacterium]|nr:hypothetical protein [Chthonomonadaceae bacterium]
MLFSLPKAKSLSRPSLTILVLSAILFAASLPAAWAQNPWARLKNAPPVTVDTSIVLTDGTVMCHSGDSSTWVRLTPDSTGSYINGTWSAMPNLPAGYGPLYYASAVLPDGRMLM